LSVQQLLAAIAVSHLHLYSQPGEHKVSRETRKHLSASSLSFKVMRKIHAVNAQQAGNAAAFSALTALTLLLPQSPRHNK
jgi:hypothetical protein